MRSRVVLAVLIGLTCIAPVVSSAVSPHLGVEIGEPLSKVVDGPDDDADLTISVSVRVKNTTGAELSVELTIQGLDKDGAEVFDMFLNDAVKPGQERLFTDTDYMQERRYKSIVTWRVEEATIRGGAAQQPR